jgi:cold shock CspA family protein
MIKSEIKNVRRSNREDGIFYGFIAALDGGKDYYFTTQDFLAEQSAARGAEVEFEPIEEGTKRYARNVRLIENNGGKTKIVLPKVVSKPVKPTVAAKTLEEWSSGIMAQVETLCSVTDPELFEDGVFLLLRLLGIHTAYQYPRSAQAGEADGFFMIESLAVMYDCTLRDNFETYKQTQIENYKNRLSQRTQLTFEFRKADGGIGRKTVPLAGKKQVWIITRGETRELEDFGGIKVKEIAVADLCKVLERRMRDIACDVDRVATDLTLLGNA